MNELDIQIKKISGSLLRNYPPYWDIRCGKCWKSDRVKKRGPISSESMIAVAEILINRGWRHANSISLCPACVKINKNIIIQDKEKN